MKPHGWLLGRAWTLSVVVGVLIAGHLLVPYLLAHFSVSVAIVSGVTALIVAKHRGVIAALVERLRAALQRSGVE